MLAIAFGALLARRLFLSYIFLICGVFLATFTLLFMYDHGRRGVWRAVTYSADRASSRSSLLYLILAAATGLRPDRDHPRRSPSSRWPTSSRSQRPFPQHILFDLLDFALGSGWISFLLVVFYLAQARGGVVRLFAQPREQRLVFLALLQIAIVALRGAAAGRNGAALAADDAAADGADRLGAGALAAEVPRWSSTPASGSCSSSICQNMTFIYMGPELDGPRRLTRRRGRARRGRAADDGAGELANQRHALDHHADAADHRNERPRRRGVEPVEGRDLGVDEAGRFHHPLELPAEERRLVRRIAGPALDDRHVFLHGDLRVEHVGLGERDRAAAAQYRARFLQRGATSR